METKKCTKCRGTYPATTEYFPKDKCSKSGFHSWCRTCFNRTAREKWQSKKPIKKYQKAERDLPKVYIPNLNMKIGKKYSFLVDKQGKGTEKRKFAGEVIQICDTHIVFKTKNYIESFLKVDLKNYKMLEV
jgi:hypothetical protein